MGRNEVTVVKRSRRRTVTVIPEGPTLSERAREHTDAAIDALVSVMNKGSDAAKISAANSILDRGWAGRGRRWRSMSASSTLPRRLRGAAPGSGGTMTGKSVSVRDPHSDLARDIASFTHDPLGHVLYAYPWSDSAPEERNRAARLAARRARGDRRAPCRSRHAPSPCRIARASGHGIGKSALIGMVVKWRSIPARMPASSSRQYREPAAHQDEPRAQQMVEPGGHRGLVRADRDRAGFDPEGA